MAIVPWPLVSRSDLVTAFKPGTDGDREAPIRTLREHRWVSKGISVRSRAGSRAAGSLTLFSWLNLDAARAARRGDTKAASLFAKEAAKLESSAPFAEIAQLLSSVSSLTASALLQGVLTEGAPKALDLLLRSAATATERRRLELTSSRAHADAVFGKVSKVDSRFVEVEDREGVRTRLSRAMAEAAHRAELGDCLGVYSDQLSGSQLIISARPALETRAELPRRAFNPFERADTPRVLTPGDVALLSRPPSRLPIRIPVTIEQ